MSIINTILTPIELKKHFNLMMRSLESELSFLLYNSKDKKTIVSKNIHSFIQHITTINDNSRKQWFNFINMSYSDNNYNPVSGYSMLHGYSLLLLACHYSVEDIEILIEKGAKVNQKSTNGDNVLSLLLKNNDACLKHVLLLTDNGFRINHSKLKQIKNKRPDIYQNYQKYKENKKLKGNVQKNSVYNNSQTILNQNKIL